MTDVVRRRHARRGLSAFLAAINVLISTAMTIVLTLLTSDQLPSWLARLRESGVGLVVCLVAILASAANAAALTWFSTSAPSDESRRATAVGAEKPAAQYAPLALSYPPTRLASAPYAPLIHGSRQPRDNWALAAVTICWLSPPIGGILGIIALRSMARKGTGGKGMAQLAIVVMMVWLLATAGFVAYLVATTPQGS